VVDIDTVVQELYSLPPEAFTAARRVREREARATGDKELATSIHQLRKPSTGAWLTNQLVREHAAEIKSFLDLGAALREATTMLSGDQLRELGKQRRHLVNALIQQVRELADAAGHKVSQDTARAVEDTLHAALADEQAADRLSAGLLTDTLQGAGFLPAASTPSDKAVPNAPSTAGAKDQSTKDRSSRDRPTRGESTRGESTRGESTRGESTRLRVAGRQERADRDEQLARAAGLEAEAEENERQAAFDRTERALQEAAAVVSGLRAALQKAEAEQTTREQDHGRSQADRERATRAAQQAARRLDEAVQRRERLSHST